MKNSSRLSRSLGYSALVSALAIGVIGTTVNTTILTAVYSNFDGVIEMKLNDGSYLFIDGRDSQSTDDHQ